MQVGWAKWKLGMKLPYMFVFSENWHDYVINMKRKKLVYYTVDEQASFSGLDGQRFIEMDKKLNQAADVIFCSARTLYDKNIKTNINTHYMPHGVSYSLFSSTLEPGTQIASDIKDIPHPIYLCFGHISHDWVDKDLVKFLAKERPNYSWVYVGRYSMDENEFKDHANIHLLGEKEFDELMVLDIDATKENRGPNFEMIKNLADECRMPFCYGGGISTVEEARKMVVVAWG